MLRDLLKTLQSYIRMDRILLCLFVCCVAFSSRVADATFAVKDLNVTDITTSSATIIWSLPSSTENITEYQLSYRTATVKIADTNTTSYALTGLDHWTMYNPCVTSVLIDDTTEQSCIVFTTKYDPGNYYALAAAGVAGSLLLILVLSMICDARMEAKLAAKREKIAPANEKVDTI
ncbi:uncharacterized protein [Ptychodera flava]|uniref:uncharacterized protein n=1 Tax=Ptychodera flava TaxID=63121 RepID=UPI00396A1912